MIYWTTATTLDRFIKLGNTELPSRNIVYVIDTRGYTGCVAEEFITVQQLNVLFNAAVLQVSSQEEITSFLRSIFLKTNSISSILIYTWSQFDFEWNNSIANVSRDHAFLNVVSELGIFRDVKVVLRIPPAYQIEEAPSLDSEFQGRNTITNILSRWKRFR